MKFSQFVLKFAESLFRCGAEHHAFTWSGSQYWLPESFQRSLTVRNPIFVRTDISVLLKWSDSIQSGDPANSSLRVR